MDDFTEEVFMQHKEKTNTILIEKLKKNYSYEWEKLLFEYERPYIFHDTVLYLEDETIFDFWKNNFDIEKNLHFNKFNQIHYGIPEKKECVPFLLKFENICGIIERGENEDRNHYFKPTALLQTSFIHEIFAQIEDKMCSLLEIDYSSIVDSQKFQINSKQKLPLNKIIYFRNLIVVFEEVEKTIVRRREKNKLVARILSGEVLLNKKK